MIDIDNQAAGVPALARGATEWVSAAAHKAAMVSRAAALARAVLRGDQTLPEALDDIEAWLAAQPDQVVGDPIEPQVARQRVLAFVRSDVVEGIKLLPPNWAIGLRPEEKAEHQRYFGIELEVWTRDRALDHLQEKFLALTVEDTAGRLAVIEAVLLGMARSHVGDLDADEVIRFIHRAGRLKVTTSALRKRLKELQSPALKGENHTEIAEALIKELEREGELRFAHDMFYRWAGSHWVQLERSYIMQTVAREFGKLPAATRHYDHKGIYELAGNLVSKELASVDVPGINFANGYLTTDLELLPHEPKYGATYVMPHRYVPDMTAPVRLISVLDQSWGGDTDYADKVQALREAMAATMFGLASKFSRAFCLYGLPHSGKTVIMEVIKGMVPKGVCSNVSPHDWGNTFLPTQMLGALINFCGEISETRMIAGDRFKTIVEGGELNGQYKGGQIFKFKPTCAQWFSSNHLPRTQDTSGGFTRRWLFLTFERAVPVEARVIKYEDVILAEEREAIAAWALPAILDVLRRHNYTEPASHKVQIEEIASLNNPVRHFLKSSRVVYAPGAATREGALYGACVAFAHAAGHTRAVSLPRFRTELRRLQHELGIQVELQPEWDPPVLGIAVRERMPDWR